MNCVRPRRVGGRGCRDQTLGDVQLGRIPQAEPRAHRGVLVVDRWKLRAGQLHGVGLKDAPALVARQRERERREYQPRRCCLQELFDLVGSRKRCSHSLPDRRSATAATTSTTLSSSVRTNTARSDPCLRLASSTVPQSARRRALLLRCCTGRHEAVLRCERFASAATAHRGAGRTPTEQPPASTWRPPLDVRPTLGGPDFGAGVEITNGLGKQMPPEAVRGLADQRTPGPPERVRQRE